MAYPDWLVATPIAHRGLHDGINESYPENSRPPSSDPLASASPLSGTSNWRATGRWLFCMMQT